MNFIISSRHLGLMILIGRGAVVSYKIVTSRAYLAKLEADFADFMKERGSERLD